MNELQIPTAFSTEINTFFKDTLNPLKLAYAVCSDEYLNFKIIKTTHPHFRMKEVSAYEIPALMRLLTNKSNILSEENIYNCFPTSDNSICYILEWGKVKSILLFCTENLDNFADLQFTKDLQGKREQLQSLFKEV